MNNHHGQIIEKVIRKHGHSITDVARMTKVNRRSVYNWFSQQVLKPHIIINIGEAIQHDFSNDIPTLKKEGSLLKGNKNDEGWKDKYVDLLERYNQLLIRSVEHSIS